MLSAFICGMTRHKSAKTVKLLIENGQVKTIKEVFDHIPITPVARYLGTNFSRLNKYVQHPALFSYEDAFLLAAYFEIDAKTMSDIIFNSITAMKPKRKPGKSS